MGQARVMQVGGTCGPPGCEDQKEASAALKAASSAVARLGVGVGGIHGVGAGEGGGCGAGTWAASKQQGVPVICITGVLVESRVWVWVWGCISRGAGQANHSKCTVASVHKPFADLPSLVPPRRRVRRHPAAACGACAACAGSASQQARHPRPLRRDCRRDRRRDWHREYGSVGCVADGRRSRKARPLRSWETWRIPRGGGAWCVWRHGHVC